MLGGNLKPKTYNLKPVKNGFSIIEVIIVLGIVAIFVSGVIPLFLNVISINKTSEYKSIAYKLLDSNIEELRAGSFNGLATGNCPLPVSSLPGSPTCQLTVTDIEDGLKKVKIVISWYFKRNQSISTVTYIAREGIKR